MAKYVLRGVGKKGQLFHGHNKDGHGHVFIGNEVVETDYNFSPWVLSGILEAVDDEAKSWLELHKAGKPVFPPRSVRRELPVEAKAKKEKKVVKVEKKLDKKEEVVKVEEKVEKKVEEKIEENVNKPPVRRGRKRKTIEKTD